MTQDNSSAQLLPCPFCGGPAERVVFGKGQKNERRGVRCADLTCGAYVRLGTHADESEALWNTRAQPSTSSVEAVARDLAKSVDDLIEAVGEVERKAINAINALPSPEREWQPIESAPKDGTEVDLWVDTPSDPMRYERCWFERDQWWFANGQNWHPMSDAGEPTHWMPLPAPPPAQSGDRT